MAFRFYRNKKYQFIWTDNKNFKIIWKNPEIQAIDDDIPVSDENGILYYYYDFTVLCRDYSGKWKQSAGTRTHDFPAVKALCQILPELMQTNIREQAERYQTQDNQWIYYKSESTAHAHSDDFYDIRRYHYTGNGKEWYQLYVGAGYQAVRIDNLRPGDLLKLRKCAEAFLAYSMEIHNQRLKHIQELNKNARLCADGKLYDCALDENGNRTGYYHTVFVRVTVAVCMHSRGTRPQGFFELS